MSSGTWGQVSIARVARGRKCQPASASTPRSGDLTPVVCLTPVVYRARVLVTITFYGYPDNDDGDGHYGTAVIAHRLRWQDRRRFLGDDGLPIAGGSGTYDDPITAAASRGNRYFPPGTMVYVPHLAKYFLVEDECATCSYDEWLDLWMESSSDSDPRLVEARQSDLTGDVAVRWPVVIDPTAGLPVDQTPLFGEHRNQ